jgi:V/A-type H+-transporting ATPase subunit I
MITKMKKLSFLIHDKEYDQFLEQLRSLGVVHVIQKQQGAVQDQDLQEDLNLLARIKNALKVLEGHKGDGSWTSQASPSEPSAQCAPETGSPFDEFVKRAQIEPSLLCPEKILERYDILEADKVVQEQTLQALNRDRAQLLPWGDFEPESVERLVQAGYKIRFYTCPLRAFKDEWTDKYGVIEILRDKQKVNFITLTHADVTPDIDAEQVQLPAMSLSAVEKDIAKTQAAIDAIPAKMAQLAGIGASVLESAVTELENRIDFGRVRLTGEKLAADTLLLLEGWIPAEKVEEVSRELDMKGVFFDIEDPTPEDDIPIQLSNNKFAKLFEPLTKLYMLPTYQELDLTLFFAPFFMLFFGLCLGDTGYGLLMIVALPIFTKLFQLINPNFSKWLVVLFGASTMLCGLLSGTFFGFNMYDLDIPFIQKMKGILYTDNSTMFTVSLCIGVVQILFGMAIKAVNLAIQCGFKYALSTIGWLVLLITVGVSALAGIPFSNPVIMGILIVAAVLIFLFNSPGKNPLLNIGLGLWDTYNMATGLLGDVLSYVRLFALGLSGGILANVFNSMAIGMKPDNPVAGFIVMVLIFVIGHALNIFMNILGAIVHPMRLTFVEFFKNAGYTGGGTEYKPFAAK